MFYFNLLVILHVDFHVYFVLLLSERTHLKGSSEKRAHRQRTLRGQTPPLPPCSGWPVVTIFRKPRFNKLSFATLLLQYNRILIVIVIVLTVF